jgi:dTDP-4-dehydrorhamnose 3,5-epimerase
MIFHETKLKGVFEIRPEPIADERGFFARTWCAQEFAERRLSSKLVQCSISFNARKGTLRGVHYQAAPHAEIKVVRCTQGSMFDVAVDLRQDSPTFRQWVGITLTATNHEMLYIPEGCAHGFLTLEDNTEALYHMSEFYNPESARGARWDDPAFQIAWPAKPRVISERDRTYPDFDWVNEFA